MMDVRHIPAICKTPPPERESETPIAGLCERGLVTVTPPDAPLWDELINQTDKNTRPIMLPHRVNSSATLSDLHDDNGRLTPLELRAMGPLLMPNEDMSILDDNILTTVANTPSAKDLDLLLKEYCITKRMNQVIVSDSLASKRQLWLDASAGMWQGIAKKQASDAFNTATALKIKEAKLETALQKVSSMEEHVEDLKLQIKLQEDVLSDRKKRVQRATTELDLKCAQRRCITGEGTEAEVDEFSQQIADKLSRIKEREEYLLRKEMDLAEMESKVQSGLKQLRDIDSQKDHISLSLASLGNRESACEMREQQLDKDNTEYVKSRELLLFEYAEIAERESAVDAKEQAAATHWNAACRQQASLEVVVSTFDKFFLDFRSALEGLTDIAAAHFDSLSDCFSESIVTVLSGSSSLIIIEQQHQQYQQQQQLHQQRQQQDQQQLLRLQQQQHQQSITLPTTPNSSRHSIHRGVVLSPAAHTTDEADREIAERSNSENEISALEASLRQRYMMGNNPQQVPVEYQHAVAVPTPRPVSVPIAPQSFENRLKERLKGTSYESRLKELLHRNTNSGVRDVNSPSLLCSSSSQGIVNNNTNTVIRSVAHNTYSGGTGPIQTTTIPTSNDYVNINYRSASEGHQANIEQATLHSASTSPSVSRGRFRVSSPSVSQHMTSDGSNKRFGTPAQRRVSAPSRDIVSPSLFASPRAPLAASVDVVFQQIRDMESFLSDIAPTSSSAGPVRVLPDGIPPPRRVSTSIMAPLVPP